MKVDVLHVFSENLKKITDCLLNMTNVLNITVNASLQLTLKVVRHSTRDLFDHESTRALLIRLLTYCLYSVKQKQ